MTLKISNFSKRFNDKWVLKDVSLEINQGEIFGILGENGVGKSTLLRLIEGTDTPNGGTISFQDYDLTKTPPKQRVFVSAVRQAKSGWKDIFGDARNSESESSKVLRQIRESMEVAESVWLLDDPFSAINQNSLGEIFTELKSKITEKNLTVVIVVNDAQTAFSFCDRVGILHNGEIVQIGTPREVYEKPTSIAAAKALGRINIITARRISFTNQNSLEFQTLQGEHRVQTDKLEVGRLGAITQNVTLAIRPEHISISFGASFPEDNLLKAQIAGVEYLGATTRLFLDANGLMLEALVLRLVGLNIGDECMVGMPPDRIMVLKN